MHDPRECHGCQRRAQERYSRFQGHLRKALGTPEGRAIIDFLVDQSGVHTRSLWEPSARLNYVVARRDFGMEIVDEAVRCNAQAWFSMEQERWTRAEAERLEVEKEEKEKERKNG